MDHSLSDIRASLLRRGVELGNPITHRNTETVSIIDINPGSGFISVYNEFDGFLTYDPLSYLRLWSLDEITHNQPTSVDGLRKNGSEWIVIGDFLMDSDFIISNITENDSPIRLLNDDRIGSRGIISFLEALLKGQFDFVK